MTESDRVPDASVHQTRRVKQHPQIPFDIWEEVFQQCLPLDAFIQPSAFTAALLLCQINRAWRDRATSMPSLWCSLSVKISRHGSIPHLDLIPTWLSRAGGHPLYISVTLDRRPGVHVYTTTDAALRSLIAFFPTWKEIHLNVGTFLNLPSLLRLPDALTPSFEYLHIYLPSYEEAAEQIALIFERSPNLSHLSLSTELLEQDIPNLKVPFGSLTTLELPISVFSPDNSWEILEYCPKLRYLRIGDLRGEFVRARRGSPILLQDLETLDLASSCGSMSVFLDAFTAPSLRTLHLVFASPFPMHSFVSLLHRSKCPLKMLRLSVHMTDEEAIHCLKACPPTLTELILYGEFVTDVVLEKLTIGTPESLCPQLQVISLGGRLVGARALATMLESRYLPRNSEDTHLRSTSIYASPAQETDVITRLQELRRLGLQIECSSFSL
ncbi:hypothetical protein Hypma_009040 [Hypsizygus marmoreus]|uniref:F-box domain-containing protein n=1 Tax=Hypsizygus marmoreus TaxID=39966 RepID=A0A369JXS5_HYPMA|nr:hypothetical protein Hypma_009040 [Hypsizygus marmoreus]